MPWPSPLPVFSEEKAAAGAFCVATHSGGMRGLCPGTTRWLHCWEAAEESLFLACCELNKIQLLPLNTEFNSKKCTSGLFQLKTVLVVNLPHAIFKA